MRLLRGRQAPRSVKLNSAEVNPLPQHRHSQVLMNNFVSNSIRHTELWRRKILNIVAIATLPLAPAAARSATATQSATTGSFTLVQPMKQFRRQQTATQMLDGRVLVAGGLPFLPAATSEIIDPITGNWTNSGPLAAGRAFHTASLLQDGRVAVTGGQTASQLLASTEIYDP